MVTEIIYTWPNGKVEVRYRREKDSKSALKLINQVLALQRKHGADCPYSYRNV